jgi:hypothetical protein
MLGEGDPVAVPTLDVAKREVPELVVFCSRKSEEVPMLVAICEEPDKGPEGLAAKAW